MNYLGRPPLERLPLLFIAPPDDPDERAGADMRVVERLGAERTLDDERVTVDERGLTLGR